jgi:hypothetical protein
LPARIAFDAALVDIGNHANHAGIGAARLRNAVDGVLSGPEPARDRLIDDDYRFALVVVIPANIAALDQVHSNRVEVTRRNNVYKRIFEFSFAIVFAFRRDTPTSISAHWQVVSDAGRLDAWNLIYATQNLLPDHASFGGVASIVVVHTDRGGPARPETKIDIEDPQKTPQEQPSAHQQHAGQGNLGNDQHRAHALVLLAPAHSMA